MDDYELYELQCAKRKISSIFLRIIIALFAMFFISPNSRNIVSSFFIAYILVSWCWFFVRITGNWIIGIVASWIVPILAYGKIIEKFQDNPQKAELYAYILLLAVFIIDVINIIRYFVLKSNLIKNNIAIRRLSRDEMKNYKKERRK